MPQTLGDARIEHLCDFLFHAGALGVYERLVVALHHIRPRLPPAVCLDIPVAISGEHGRAKVPEVVEAKVRERGFLERTGEAQRYAVG